MLCPFHQVPLSKSRKHGIEIDYCPQCHGAWFERGELDKVIEAYEDLRRGALAVDKADFSPPSQRSERPARRRRKALEDFLEDLFDFD